MKNIITRTKTCFWTVLLCTAFGAGAEAQTTLADQPVFSAEDVPGNLALDLSVEFPTAISVANLYNYTDSSTPYLGYFDPGKCYTYVYNAVTPPQSYFQPTSLATGTNGHSCSGLWSGNFMNWATMQTIDPFRWALTGGYRSEDDSVTILEKAWGSVQGSAGSNYPDRGTNPDTGGLNILSSSLISSVTPFTAWTSFNLRIWGNGNAMVISGSGTNYEKAAYAPMPPPTGTWAMPTGVQDLVSISEANSGDLGDTPPGGPSVGYRVFIRVKVCDATTSLGTALLESNCVQYGTNYKPEGLMQQYSKKIRFSAFSYLLQGGDVREGGVLREPMGFIGPTYPTPLSSVVTTNTRAEWSGTTGIMNINPDSATATASGVTNSGVMNYLNKFGENGKNYRTYDSVSELYYAPVRYFENLGNVPEWTNGSSAYLDGFPAVTTWTDPILYSCQKNFILGIGDDHTWYDYDVGGSTNASGPRPMPAAVTADTLNQATVWTNDLQTLEPINPLTPWWAGHGGDTGSTYFIAGLAYGVHVNDIRPDLPGAQTISTYWMDVAEDQEVENLNPFYLASKYGGFTSSPINAAPAGPAYNMLTPLTLGQWDTSGANILMNGGNTHPLPNNYFVAGNAGAMVTGLKSAFVAISNSIKAFTTSFSFSAPNISTSGTESFSTQYNPVGWTGTIIGNTLSFDSAGNPLNSPIWTSDNTLQAQLAGTGWQTNRRIATWSGGAGVPFEAASLSPAQLSALSPSSYSSSTTSTQYLNYLRGDQTNEVGSTATGSTDSLRPRALLLGDIVDAQLTPVDVPVQTFSDVTNPGYASFKQQWTTGTPRPTMVYAGANDGMLHGFVGLTGTEQFAYVPSALFQGPNNTPQIDGLAELGNPAYTHHYYVDATPYAFDMDLSRAGSPIPTGVPDWHTVLIGGLGKGGRSFYALDVTNPAAMTSEAAVASKVLWEFTDPTMGYSFGGAVSMKTVKYGWVVALTSGYDNSDGYGYLYLLNPKTGALLEKIKTPSASSGMTQASSYVRDYSDGTADSVYVGDLNGQVWRFDMTGTSGPYPQPTLLATLADGSGNPQPVTTAPLIEIHPVTRLRYVMVGTGQLLSSSDVISTQMQTFYAILDGTATAFNPVSAPITRANLTPFAATDLVNINHLSATTGGWYMDLGIDPVSGIGWRILINPQAYNGIVTFSTLLTQGNACSPSGSSRVYALDYSTVTSVLQPTIVGAPPPPYDAISNFSVIEQGFAGNNGTPEILIGGNNGTNQRVDASLTGTLATRILNWREIPTVD